MKKLFATALAGLVVAAAANGQGTVNFKNYFGHPLTDPAVWATGGSNRLSGAQYSIGLYAGATSGSEALIATTTFLTTAGAAGYFVGPSVAIPTVAGGATAFVEIAVWDTTLNGTTTGASFAQAEAYWGANRGVANIWGMSTEFTVVTGDPGATPPGLPQNLANLTSFNMNPIPEPSTIALLGLGAAGLTILRRRK